MQEKILKIILPISITEIAIFAMNRHIDPITIRVIMYPLTTLLYLLLLKLNKTK